MARYIAFLRAINVGGHTVKMEHLRVLFAELGFLEVATFIASGNVIFEAPAENARAREERIEAHLGQALGYDVATFVRSLSELAAVLDYRPFPAAEFDTAGATLSIAFLRGPPAAAAVARLGTFRSPVNDFRARGREIYWLCHGRTSESGFSGALLEKTIGMPATLRNVNTLRGIAAKYA